MQYDTKFSLGDHVWGVNSSDFNRIVRCKPCANTGKINIGGEDLICPKCSGRCTHTQYAGQKFYISEFDAVIGKVGIEHTDSLYSRWNSDGLTLRVTYMISNTGIGSGQVWSEDRLFPSEEEADTFCRQRNGDLLKDECAHGEDLIGRYGEVLAAAKEPAQ